MGWRFRDLPAIRWNGHEEGENVCLNSHFKFHDSVDTFQDIEKTTIEELASRPSLERSDSGSVKCTSDADAFRVGDLVVEIELDEALRRPGLVDEATLEKKWKTLIETIRAHMSRSTAVVIRRWTPELSLQFSKMSMALQFGELGMRCQWSDGCSLARNREKKVKSEYHKVTTMSEFIELAEDPTVCGNFLDGKNLNAGIPMWARPLLDSNNAWEHTMHLRFVQQAATKDHVPGIQFEDAPPEVIRSGTWTSQGWRLVTHGGYFTHFHHDCCGLGTHVMGDVGGKVWAILRAKQNACPSSVKELRKCMTNAVELSPDGRFPDADIAVVCLDAEDIM